MLASLSIRDIVLISELTLDFAPGLNVLTGETGAGKSILLDSLGLAGGARSDGRASVRPGASQGAVTALFQLEPRGLPLQAVRALLQDAGLDAGEDCEVILRRTVAGDGRTRAFLNDQPVGVTLLREAGAHLLEVHGQTDDRGLFDVSTHRALLDAFGGHLALASNVVKLHDAYSAASRRLEELKSGRARAEAERDYLEHAAKELKTLAPLEGEEETLASERAFLMHASRIGEDVSAALHFLAGDGGAEIGLGSALRRLSRMGAEGREAVRDAETALDGALAQLQEGRAALEDVLSRLEGDPGRQERIEERLFALRAAARKYNTKIDGLNALAEDFSAKLALLDAGEAGQGEAEKALREAKAAFLKDAKLLSAARAKAAKRLEESVAKELAPLKLGHARFRVALTSYEEDEAQAHGLERVAFEVATVEGAGFGSLTKIASGGELSRFALALKVALAETSPPAVLVFDEIDRGVGGAVAAAVGERLQRLAKTTQVLLVTHSPQVAARGVRHFRVSRKGDATKVETLSDADRLEEIARMLAGTSVTSEARAAAKTLLAEAHMAAKPAPLPPKKRARV